MKKSDVIDIPGVETVGLVVREYQGYDCLFTTDGKLVASQVKGDTFHWQIRHTRNAADNEKAVRATFVNVAPGTAVE